MLVCDDMLVLERRKEAQNKQSCGWSLLSSPYHDLKHRLGAEPQGFLFCMLLRMGGLHNLLSELRYLH